MADAKKGTAEAGEARAAVPLMSLLLAVVAAVLVAVGVLGGAGFWLVKSGRLPLGGGVQKVEAATRPDAKTKLVALDPLLVNLADTDGHSYLRVALTLKVDDSPAPGEKAGKEVPAKGKPVNAFEAEERDLALGVIGRQTGAALEGADGKQQLKDALKAVLAERLPEARVKEVLFTEFLVQR